MTIEFKAAVEALDRARENFDNADIDHVEAAIFDMRAAEERLNAEIRRLRQERKLNF